MNLPEERKPFQAKEDEPLENSLRPAYLKDFVGQEKLKKNFRIFIQAARKRKEPLDHCLFCAPPGLGKTTLANIIANELGANLRSTAGPVLERAGDLASILTSLNEGDVFFIDEIHRLNHIVKEALYPVMEDFKLDIVIGQGPSAKTIKLDIPRFTLIGATTRSGMLTTPMRERFGIVSNLDYYTVDDLKAIVCRSSRILSIPIEDNAAVEIAKRSRGTPRIANRLLRRVRDFAEVQSAKTIETSIVKEATEALGIDNLGLDSMDKKILTALIDKFSGGPVGLETLSIAVSEEIDNLTDVYEPYLIQSGFLVRTPRGRMATPNAYEHLGKPRIQKELSFQEGKNS